jgi:hypothetical protein
MLKVPSYGRNLMMSMRDIDRIKTIQAVADGNLRAVTAASRLHLTRPQVDRLVDRYRADGADGLSSRCATISTRTGHCATMKIRT